MKRKVPYILAILATVFCFGACENAQDVLDKIGMGSKNSMETSSNVEESETASNILSDSSEDSSSEDSSDSSEDKEEEDEPKYTYNAFTFTEKQLCETYLGEVLPFLPNNEYYFETYEEDGLTWINFAVCGKTQANFNAYRTQYYAGYTLTETYVDDDGDTWYCYEKGDLYVEMAYYAYEGKSWIDVYAVYDTEEDDGGAYAYYDFTNEEKALFMQYIGEVIPFLPNDGYYVEGYYEETDYENGMCFYTYGVTDMGFALYRGMYSDYDYVGTWTDEEDDTWYCYEKGDLYVEMVYYYSDGDFCMEVYVTVSNDDENVGGDVGGDDNADLITNDGKGLPTDADGVYDVDFTKATYVKDVTEQGYYLDGCPTTGNVKVLVIPVEFSDVTAASKGYSLDKIDLAFNGAAGTTDYRSVSEYYSASSYGKLNLDFVVLDSWFRPAKNSTYYADAAMDYGGEEIAVGDQMIMDEALAYLESRMDLSEFDSDNNAIIDAVVMINTLDIDSDSDFQWAYRYWNVYTDDQGYYYEYDAVSANDYLWASYQFLLETYDADGEVYYDDDTFNTYTYIHEFGHVLGADDYYDTAYEGAPMDGYDIMDSMTGDHNAYTKFNYGWLTSSRLVVAEERITLTLEAFAENGDTLLIANDWDEKLGVYQEYFLVVYYTNSGLNGGEYGYFDDEGILVYHINASLYKEISDGETYYDVYNNNTDASNEYGTENNLIEYVTTAYGDYVYGVGDSLSASVKTDAGEKIAYTFKVNALNGNNATITFEKND